MEIEKELFYKCNKCYQILSIDEFKQIKPPKHRGSLYHKEYRRAKASCIQCENIYYKEWREKNKDKITGYHRKRYIKKIKKV